ncbi:MAG TPA: hypothetical protein VNC61_00250 [Acidimicrobiales bacterium]|nr:hypothetical protein [Acidimicrobiales bacterium]
MTPKGVIRAVLVRMGQLPDDARKLAAAMAVLGGNALLREAASLVDLDPSAAAHFAGLLTRASVIAGVEPLEFVHPIVRNGSTPISASVIARSCTPGRRASSTASRPAHSSGSPHSCRH